MCSFVLFKISAIYFRSNLDGDVFTANLFIPVNHLGTDVVIYLEYTWQRGQAYVYTFDIPTESLIPEQLIFRYLVNALKSQYNF